MALSLDDKLLGEKVNNYCSSSEDEGDDDSDENDKCEEKSPAEAPKVPQPTFQNYQGYCTNTGPKGVLTDWREFKRLENERREESEIQKLELAKKLSITCRSYLNDEEEKAKENEIDEFALDDAFLEEYRLKRLQEMRNAVQAVPTFGNVCHLDRNNYVTSIDSEKPNVTVLVHVYNTTVPACEAMSGCFKCLAKDYPHVKFCEISAIDANLSSKFAFDGVPAILAYRSKQLIGNYIGLAQELGHDFFATDIEAFLIEHGMLPFNDKRNLAIRDSTIDELSDSDFEVD